MKYIKKPVEVEAVQWNGENTEEILEFTNRTAKLENGEMKIATLEGTMTVNVGDYIIKGVKGEVYPCKPDIFKATYTGFEGHGLCGKDVKAEIITQHGRTKLLINGKEISKVLATHFHHNSMKNNQPELYYTVEVDVFK